MNETKIVKVRLADGTIKECSIEIPPPLPWKFIFSGLDLKPSEFTGRDLFEALIALRLELEKIGAQLLCAGARLCVFPSGMSRDMGGGRKAFVTRLGSPMNEEAFDIFDYAEPELVSSVDKQKEFYERWVESLKLR